MKMKADTLRNPMLIHTIQDRLCELINSQSLVVQIWADNAGKHLPQVMKEIVEQATDNRRLVSELIGEELLRDIEAFTKKHLKNGYNRKRGKYNINS